MHALRTLDQLKSLNDDDLQLALADQSGGVREHGVAAGRGRAVGLASIAFRVVQLASDESPRVRFQVAFSLGEANGAEAVGQEVVAGLATVGRRDGEDLWVRTAILSSSRLWAEPLLRELAQ